MDAAEPVEREEGFGVAVVGTAVLAVLALVLFGLLVFYVPGAKRTFDQYGLTLPWATQATIRLSHWVSECWWCAVLALGGNFVLLDFLARRGRIAPALLVAAEALWLGALVALVAVSILLPIAKLQEGLAR